MDAVQSYVPNQQILDTELNGIQRRAVGVVLGDNANFYTAGGVSVDTLGRAWLDSGAGFITGTLLTVDGSLDFRDRVLTVSYAKGTSTNQHPGEAGDTGFDGAVTWRRGYTGTGARDAGGVAAPTTGNPPVVAVGVSWAMQLATNVWLYADPSDGSLRLYNDSGGTLYVVSLTLYASEVGNWR